MRGEGDYGGVDVNRCMVIGGSSCFITGMCEVVTGMAGHMREGTIMKRFKKLAAGVLAAGMALAMLPMAAAQAAEARTLTIETKVTDVGAQELQIDYYVTMGRTVWSTVGGEGSGGAAGIGWESIPDGTVVAGSVFKNGMARYTTTPGKKLVLPFTASGADKYDEYEICTVLPANVDVSPVVEGSSGCSQRLYFEGIGAGHNIATINDGGQLDQNRTETVTFSKRFRDVTASTPHLDDVDWLSYWGISEGWKEADGSRTFRGMDTVKRQDMAAFLYRVAKKRCIADICNAGNDTADWTPWEPSAADWKRFSDVNPTTPHAKEILWLAHAGISTGWKEADGSYTFRGMDTVKRQDMAAFLKRLANKDGKGNDVQPKYSFVDVAFTGANKTPHADDIAWLAGAGISEGWKVGNTYEFRGMSSVVRQDMAAFIHRLDNLLWQM